MAADRHDEMQIRSWLKSNIRGGRRHATFTITAPAGMEASAAGADFEVLVMKGAGGLFGVRYTDEIRRDGLTAPSVAKFLAEIARRVRDPAQKFARFDDLQKGE